MSRKALRVLAAMAVSERDSNIGDCDRNVTLTSRVPVTCQVINENHVPVSQLPVDLKYHSLWLSSPFVPCGECWDDMNWTCITHLQSFPNVHSSTEELPTYSQTHWTSVYECTAERYSASRRYNSCVSFHIIFKPYSLNYLFTSS